MRQKTSLWLIACAAALIFDPVSTGLGSENATMIEELPVRYLLLDPDWAAPGYFDVESKTFYRWQGRKVPISQVPNTQPHHRVPILDPSRLPITVVDFPVPND